MTTNQHRKMVLDNFIEHYTTDEAERQSMKDEADIYNEETENEFLGFGPKCFADLIDELQLREAMLAYLILTTPKSSTDLYLRTHPENS